MSDRELTIGKDQTFFTFRGQDAYIIHYSDNIEIVTEEETKSFPIKLRNRIVEPIVSNDDCIMFYTFQTEYINDTEVMFYRMIYFINYARGLIYIWT